MKKHQVSWTRATAAPFIRSLLHIWSVSFTFSDRLCSKYSTNLAIFTFQQLIWTVNCSRHSTVKLTGLPPHGVQADRSPAEGVASLLSLWLRCLWAWFKCGGRTLYPVVGIGILFALPTDLLWPIACRPDYMYGMSSMMLGFRLSCGQGYQT